MFEPRLVLKDIRRSLCSNRIKKSCVLRTRPQSAKLSTYKKQQQQIKAYADAMLGERARLHPKQAAEHGGVGPVLCL